VSKKNLSRSAIWSVMNQSVGQGLVFIVFLVTARFVSKEAFGIMATSMLAVELFRQILIESVGNTFLARKSPTHEDYNAGFIIIFTGGAIAATGIFLTARPLANLFGHSEIASTLRWVSLLLLTTGLSKMHEVWLIQNHGFKTLAIRSVTSICIGGGIGIVLAVNGFGIESLIVQQIVTAVVSAIWLWLASTWRPSMNIQWMKVKEIFNFCKYVSLNSTTGFISGQGDVLLSSLYLGPAATGVYNAAKRLLTAISLVVSSGLNSVALPTLASLSDDPDRFKNSFLKCVSLTTLFTAPLFAGLGVLSQDVISILMGNKWSDVAPVLSILCIVGFITSFLQYSTNILLIKQKSHWITLFSFLDAAVNMALLILIARYGILYLAFAFVLKSLFLSPILIFLSLKLLGLKISDYLITIAIPVSLALIMAVILYYAKILISLNAILNIIILVPLGAGIYILLSAFLNKNSSKDALKFFGKIFHK
jgi:O-antigen/teichoic acid export membrane protein